MTEGQLDRDHIRRAVFLAIDKVSESLGNGRMLARDESTVLLGDDAAVDSMGFVNLIAAVEEEMSAITGESCELVDRISTTSMDHSNSWTVAHLIDLLHDS
jgi:acyl carrier protein